MSVFSAIIVFFVGGLLSLIIRIFFFVNVRDVDKSHLNKIKINSFSLIAVGVLFLSISIILFLIFYKDYGHPLKMVINDFNKTKIYLFLILIVLSGYFLILNERIINSWEEDGIRIPLHNNKYKKFAISVGIFFLIAGILVFVI